MVYGDYYRMDRAQHIGIIFICFVTMYKFVENYIPKCTGVMILNRVYSSNRIIYQKFIYIWLGGRMACYSVFCIIIVLGKFVLEVFVIAGFFCLDFLLDSSLHNIQSNQVFSFIGCFAPV